MEFDYSKEPGKKRLDRQLNTEGSPLVSIITPYYNAGKYFEQTFNCVMNQTFPWFEWIIVDDGSTVYADVELLEQYSQKDQRIRVFHKENGGISTARNRAIQESKTDIIIPLDADDLIEPTFIETQYWALQYNSQAAWAYTKNVGFQNQEYLWDRAFSSETLKTYNFLTYAGAIRKQALLEVGCYDEVTKHYYEDWRTWLKLVAVEKFPVKLDYYGFWYRRMDTGVLSIVNKDSEVQKIAQKLISEVADQVKRPVEAIEYPRSGKVNAFEIPKMSSFDRKIFKEHKKIHVMMLIPWMEMGGADKFNLDVVSRIDKTRFEVSILTTVSGKNSWRQRFEEYVTDIFELPSFLDIENYAEFISYFIKSREIDVLFLTNSYYGYYLVPWLRKNFPKLAIIDYVHMEEWYWRNGGYARTSGVMGELLEKTYVCNERTRQVMLHDFGRNADSVETLYIGVDHDKYDAVKIETGKVRKQYGIKEDSKVILFPCRMHPQKRPFLMLEIAERLRNRKIEIVVAGDGEQLNELQAVCQQKKLGDIVHFAGRVNDMRPYYRDADITLICSLKEGLALTAYESLSMGVPVVSSDVGGQKELIDDAVGRIIPLYQNEEKDLDNREFSKEEIDAYVKAIEGILTNQENYTAMSKVCRTRIEEGFSSEIMIHKLEKIFDNLVNNTKLAETRQEKSNAIAVLGNFAEDYCTTYQELESRDSAGYGVPMDDGIKGELMRIAYSKWGKRIIKLAFKLKLNKLF